MVTVTTLFISNSLLDKDNKTIEHNLLHRKMGNLRTHALQAY